MQLMSPPHMLNRAPRVLNRVQNSEYRMVGRLALAATAKASATRNAMFCPLADDAAEDRHDADDDHGAAGDLDLGVGVALAPLDDAGVDVVGEAGRRGDGEAGDHREDRREGDRGDDARAAASPPSSKASSGAAEFTPPGAARIVSWPTRPSRRSRAPA